MKPLRHIGVGAASRAGEFGAAALSALRWIKVTQGHAA
jgi:hypothetical protein